MQIMLSIPEHPNSSRVTATQCVQNDGDSDSGATSDQTFATQRSLKGKTSFALQMTTFIDNHDILFSLHHTVYIQCTHVIMMAYLKGNATDFTQ